MNTLNLIKKYVPRHIRLGVCCELPIVRAFQSVVESIPVVNDKGSVITTSVAVKDVPVDEVMSKYKASAFRLSALVKSGVPLKLINVNATNVATIQELKRVCESIDSAETYINRVNADKAERESWFKSLDDSQSNSNSNVNL